MISKEPNKHKHEQVKDLSANAIGFWGIGCTAMAQLYLHIQKSNPQLKFGYYDVKHEEEVNASITSLSYKNIHLQLNQTLTQPQTFQFFNAADCVIVNGNHHHTSNMMLILDGKKEFKANKQHLENTSVIFYNNDTAELAKNLSIEHPKAALCLGTDLSAINLYIQKYIEKNKAALYGLVLTGGQSSRMKENKSLITYHNEPQWLHLFKLLQNKCAQTFVSSNQTNAAMFEATPVILDKFIGFGPLSGILSALMQFKDKAILVLACDLPLIDADVLNHLISERDTSKMATTFLNTESNFLEPLITIYEPKALNIMLSMLAQGYTCPRKMLMQNDIKIIESYHPHVLKNINHPEERDEILKMLQKTESI